MGELRPADGQAEDKRRGKLVTRSSRATIVRVMWRRAFFACLALLAFGGPVSAQSAPDFLGVWYDVPVPRAPARRVTLHHVEIAAVPTLRPPARYSVHIWARCLDEPTDVCDLGTSGGVARTLGGGLTGIYVELNPPRGDITRACMFNMLLAPGSDPAFPDHPDNHKGLDYRLTPPTSACRTSPYSGIGQTLGRLSRNPPLELRPIEPVAPPRLPRRP